MQVSITVSFVLKLTGSPVLTQLRTGPKKYRFSVPIPTGDAFKVHVNMSIKPHSSQECSYCF